MTSHQPRIQPSAAYPAISRVSSHQPRIQLICLRLGLVLFFVGMLFAPAFLGNRSEVPSVAAHPSINNCVQPCSPPTFYGVDTNTLNTALSGIWPQQSGPYCGITTIMAMVNYDDLIRGQSRMFTTQSQQATIASDNNHAYAESQWGHVLKSGNLVAGESNISYDYGTDPRSIAYMAWNYSMYPTYFHDYIYRWQFSNSTQPDFFTQAEQATTVVGHGLEYWHEPFSVTINSGEHSVLVTGIYSYTDPASNYPADIDSVVYRDPQNGNRYQATFYQWGRDGIYESGAGTYSLWSQFYGSTSDSQVKDPQPSVGPYKPTATAPQHWYGGFTWIQRDSHYSGVTWSPDWSYTSTNVLMQTP